MYTIFYTVHAMLDKNNVINFKIFEEDLRELERAQRDGRTDRQTNQMHKHLPTLLESVKKKKSYVIFKRNDERI